MGGKKKANRTKGNVRPSSSGRSAELLCSSGVATVGFIGFSTLSSDVLNYVPATSQVSEEYISTAVDGDFRMVMRKMFKRDSITKLKALQEFTDLCKNKDEELLKGALPYWPRIYNQLALDFDRRVREATHEAHRQLVKKVGRNLAPHLRSIMGVWLICQNDPYSPAATTAKSSFNEAFTENKQGEALMYCKDEIFNYIQDNLFNQIHQNFQNLTDNNSDLLEDVENRYYRILSCSLEGCKLFILNISPNNYEKIHELIEKILSETKFWKFAKHKELMVQISWYNLILSLCEKMFHCIRPYASKLCQLTLGSLAQNDPLLTVLTWDATLYILSIFENCWQHVNAKKTVFPQLWIVLKSGGQGNAVILFPKLLPFLSKIPDNLIEDKISFHQNLFKSMRESLNLEKVQNSPSELNSIIQAFIECIQYILSKYCKSEDKELQHHIILNELISLLETSMIEEKSSLASSCLYAKTKELLDYIQYQNANNNSLKKSFEETLTFFWDNFFIMCKSVMDENRSSNQDKLSRLAEFFYCLHCPTRIKKWKVKKKVNFLKEEDFDENLTETEYENIDNDKLFIKQNDYINTNPHLVIPTQKLCETIMMKFETSKNLVYLKLLCEVMSVAASSDLFSILLQSKGILVNNNSPKEYFYKVVIPWMESIDNVDLDKKQYIYCFVNIVMAICSCIDYKEAESILNDFIKCNNPVKLECLMSFTKFETFKFLRKWLQGPNIGEIIVKQAEELCQVTYRNSIKESYVLDSVWNILHLCLTTTEQFEPIIGIEYMSRILEIFRQCLINSKNNQETKKKDVIEFVCDLTVRLFSSFKGYWQIYGAEELLLSLFFISCDLDTSEPISEKLIQSWQLGVKHLIIERKDFFQQDGFFSKAGIKIHQQLLNQLNCMKSQEKLFLCTFKLLSTMQEALLDDNNEIFHPSISLLLNNIFPSDKEWEKLQNSLDSQYVTSTVLSNYLSSVTTEIWPSDSIPENQRLAMQDKLVALIMRILVKHPELHYYQGYHDICVTFLLVLGEEVSFVVLERLSINSPKVSATISEYSTGGHLRVFMDKTMDNTTEILGYIYVLVKKENPKLRKFLEDSEVGVMFGLSWLITWFGHVLNKYDEVVRLFDLFLSSHPWMPMYLTTAIVLHRQDEIMKQDCDMASVHCLLSQFPDNLPIENLVVKSLQLFYSYPPEELIKDEKDMKQLKCILDVSERRKRSLNHMKPGKKMIRNVFKAYDVLKTVLPDSNWTLSVVVATAIFFCAAIYQAYRN